MDKNPFIFTLEARIESINKEAQIYTDAALPINDLRRLAMIEALNCDLKVTQGQLARVKQLFENDRNAQTN